MDQPTTPAELFSLQGKVALVTGATVGLGHRFAQVLANAGARVAITGRRSQELDDLASELPGSVAVAGDLSDHGSVSEIHRRVTEALGPVDVLVNNAAYIAGAVRAEDESLDQVQRTLAVNLVAPILLAQCVIPSMRDRGDGSIINVTSIAARVGIGRFPQATYAASKGGLEAITREWAAQWSRYGIRVNAIAPGIFESEMTAHAIHVENVQDWILRNTLIQRHGQVSDFDGALLYLASDASRYVTGQTIVVDGGWSAH